LSGISGIFYRDGRPVQQSDIQDMTSAISHRGPDGQGIWLNGPVGFGHSLLRTTPESIYEVQPAKNFRDDLYITADARIDNRDELISKLNIVNRQTSNISDSELILAAYDKWGENCARNLIGDFSFAIWDKRNQQLYCAIDHLRLKPFCYYNSRDSFIFSSQVSGLLPGNLAPKKINEIRLGSYFIDDIAAYDNAASYYQDIFYLPPASYLITDKNSFTIKEYWSPEEVKDIHRNSDSSYQEEFLSILGEAVKCRLRSENDTAISLSGGIDSSTVAAISKSLLENTNQKQISISELSGNEESCRESSYIRTAISSLSQFPILIKPDSMQSILSDMVALKSRFDSPRCYEYPDLLSLYKTAKLSKCKVMLTGVEADTLLSLSLGQIAHLMKNLHFKTAIKETFLFAKNTSDFSSSTLILLIRAMRAAYFPDNLRPVFHRLRNHFDYKKMLTSCMINPAFANRIDLPNLLASAQEKNGYGIGQSPNEMRIRVYKKAFMSQMPLFLDLMSSACSIELRHPYQDKRLIEYCLGLPADQKQRDGWEKYILRKVTKDKVPDAIRWRKGGGEHVGWEYNVAYARLIYPELMTFIEDKNNQIFEYFDFKAIQTLLKKYNSDPGGQSGNEYDDIVHLYGLNSWLLTKMA